MFRYRQTENKSKAGYATLAGGTAFATLAAMGQIDNPVAILVALAAVCIVLIIIITG